MSSRVQVVRGMLEAASVPEIADAPAPAQPEAKEPAPPETGKQDADLSNAIVPWMPLKVVDTEQHCIVVREVRRWREDGEQSSVEARGQHRELVMLYVLSDRGALQSKKDIVMKFNT